MSKNREIEAKTLLSKETYQKLIADFSIKSDFKQANYYFDTPESDLKKKKISLRIRIFEDHAEQTMKVPDLKPVQKNFHEVIEINDDLSSQLAHENIALARAGKAFSFKGNVGKYLDEHFANKQAELKLFTWSKTHRILANGPDNCELTFDATTYPDGFEDFELEIENTKPDLIQKVQQKLEKKYGFKQTKENTNQNKIARAAAHQK